MITTPFHPAYMTRERIEKAKNLKLLLTAGIGSDHIDLHAAADHGLTVAECVGATRGCAWPNKRILRVIHARAPSVHSIERALNPDQASMFILFKKHDAQQQEWHNASLNMPIAPSSALRFSTTVGPSLSA